MPGALLLSRMQPTPHDELAAALRSLLSAADTDGGEPYPLGDSGLAFPNASRPPFPPFPPYAEDEEEDENAAAAVAARAAPPPAAARTTWLARAVSAASSSNPLAAPPPTADLSRRLTRAEVAFAALCAKMLSLVSQVRVTL